MALLVGFGLARSVAGTLPHQPASSGAVPLGHASGGLILGVSAFFLLRAFANGSSAMTGTEAISNGVSIFRVPQARNARTTLVLMSTILGVMFLGVSVLAALTHSVPFVSGTPTVVSEIGHLVYGTSQAGRVLFYSLQAATALILILAANTSFTGFPFLVSFVAEDSFLPRKLTIRGHRLVFSNGILLLAGASIVLLLATEAKVAALIPMYAIGVFTGFTMAGAGMAVHHFRHREQRWRRHVAVNGFAAVVCAVVVVVFVLAEFTQGAWVVVVVMPLLVYALVTMNREYRAEDAVLEEGVAAEACEAKVLRRHVVIVLVDRIDLATARAIQYARTLTPDDLHAVHFNIDHKRAGLLMERWQRLGLSRLPLDVVDCPDRRLGRAALELAAEQADGETEVSMLLPRRSYGRTWRRILHDQTADRIVEVVSQLPHVNATIIPFHVAAGMKMAEYSLDELTAAAAEGPGVAGLTGAPDVPAEPKPGNGSSARPLVPGTRPIASLQWRTRARVAGRIKSIRVQPLSDVPTVECVIADGSGEAVTLVFLGRRTVAGLHSGTLVSRGGNGRQAQGPARDDQSVVRSPFGGAERHWPMSAQAPSPSVRSAAAHILTWDGAQWMLAIVAPIAVALLLVPARGHLTSADDALVLVVVTVAIASAGSRARAFVAALVAAASFDFLLTQPYGSFRISRQADVTTEVLFVVVGLLVGELAARGRRHRADAAMGRHEIARLHDVSQRIAEGEDPDFVLIAVAGELRELLSLQDCRFVRDQPSGKGAWIASDGSVHLNPLRWPAATVGLPTKHVELPVRGGGEIVGTFILTPTPTMPITHEQCVVAVALADQLGASMANQGPGR